MQLTQFTDYTLRTLLYLGMHPERRISIQEIAHAYQISRHHLVRVSQHLCQLELTEAKRGKAGGLILLKDCQHIRIGDLVQQTEPHMHILECFDKQNNSCPITMACSLKVALYQARKAFIDTLNQYTLADALHNQAQLISQLPWPEAHKAKTSTAKLRQS